MIVHKNAQCIDQDVNEIDLYVALLMEWLKKNDKSRVQLLEHRNNLRAHLTKVMTYDNDR